MGRPNILWHLSIKYIMDLYRVKVCFKMAVLLQSQPKHFSVYNTFYLLFNILFLAYIFVNDSMLKNLNLANKRAKKLLSWLLCKINSYWMTNYLHLHRITYILKDTIFFIQSVNYTSFLVMSQCVWYGGHV